ncbi:hypothetical protein XA68_17930 [Ophiocordyceps unilateralis]|uniref:Phospholipase D n=1 Tax=Ophiocordyceps unilateralis TaxID=268505 RepID=A0A2A9PJZ8_OPHUN|nr:hypothetical protein XA68_17930 [Ophiocordyceps unilateralis]
MSRSVVTLSLAALLLISLVLSQVHSLQTGRSAASSRKSLGPRQAQEWTTDGPKPFWAIAHRVLCAEEVRAAVSDGANAIEVDLAVTNRKWYADHHDFGRSTFKGHEAWKVFQEVSKLFQKDNRNISFVWFDLKTPDKCEPMDEQCGIKVLHDLYRQYLRPHTVHVLWGFYEKEIGSPAMNWIRDNMDRGAALNIDGNFQTVKNTFDSFGLNVTKRIPVTPDYFDIRGLGREQQRVYSNGLFKPGALFGSFFKSCSTDSDGICGQLIKAIQSNYFGKVFSWTVSISNEEEAQKTMDIGVDGLIYGQSTSSYGEANRNPKKALDHIMNWIKKHPDKMYRARPEDKPW